MLAKFYSEAWNGYGSILKLFWFAVDSVYTFLLENNVYGALNVLQWEHNQVSIHIWKSIQEDSFKE